MNQNDKNKLELYGMTHNQIVELKAFLVDRYVDNQPEQEFLDDCKDYWGDHYDEIIQEIKELD